MPGWCQEEGWLECWSSDERGECEGLLLPPLAKSTWYDPRGELLRCLQDTGAPPPEAFKIAASQQLRSRSLENCKPTREPRTSSSVNDVKHSMATQ
mmetsp:Transcript_5597/g.13049  ORF Transcript_5597/g.13049 Transcript_5597/m.13049 type:complete len:96 (-) Transcript_5597:582-869(-)